MRYNLGVDLGTTYTAAAIRRGDRLEIVDLGTRNAAIPSAVFLREDGIVLTGEAAIRRGATDPARLSREFKRRMGDTTAIVLGGVPHSVDALMASMLRSVVAAVSERQGGAPSAIGVAHPANWGQYKKDLLDQAVCRADLDGVTMITEPHAAAVHYATLERLEAGSIVAVYDLGGGTFDAAVLQKTADGFELIGAPEGIERLGGIDFDEAVFRHVVGSLGGALDSLDPDDPVAQAAVSRLRDECVAAKEALSSDTEVSIPVILPNLQTEVRLTRTEFEAMIRPTLGDTMVVLRRSLRSAGVDTEQVHSVLLVGGSSRIPLIAQLVGAELGRPVALDVHPKHSVALGAAAMAGECRAVQAIAPTEPVAAVPLPAPVPAVAVAPPPVAYEAPGVSAVARLDEPVTDVQAGGSPRRTTLLVGLGLVAAAAVGVVGVLALGGGDGTSLAGGATAPQSVVATLQTVAAGVPASSPASEPSTTASPETSAPPETSVLVDPCAGVADPCIVIDQLVVTDSGAVQVTWSPRNFIPDVAGGLHAHLFWSSADPSQASTDAPDDQRVEWDAVDQTTHTSETVLLMSNRPADATGVCATVGVAPAHVVTDPSIFHCVNLPGLAG